jgi:hypothetical protein
MKRAARRPCRPGNLEPIATLLDPDAIARILDASVDAPARCRRWS